MNLHCYKLWSPAPAQQGTMPFFVRKQKRRRSLHLSVWGSRLPQSDKCKRPTPQKGCCPWPTWPKISQIADTTNWSTPQNGIPAWAFALSSLWETVEISHREQEQKLFYSHKLIKKIGWGKKVWKKYGGQEMIFLGLCLFEYRGVFFTWIMYI